MNVLVVGSGGREHAMAWRLKQCRSVKGVFCSPGNPGMAADEIVTRPTETQHGFALFSELASLTQAEKIEMIVPGPEKPLVDGIVDFFAHLAPGIKVCGPTLAAALNTEGSKILFKTLLKEYSQHHYLPTAEFQVVASFTEAEKILKNWWWDDAPLVIKAEGLCAGKGVFLPKTLPDALATAHWILKEHRLGAGGRAIVIEERLYGRECSYMALTDGQNIYELPLTRDHKRLFDGDFGPNTGGMGAYSDVPDVSAGERRIMRLAAQGVVRALAHKGMPYRGFLYLGFILTREGPKILEANCRAGDPEWQTIAMRLEGDLAQALYACCGSQGFSGIGLTAPRAAACVVLASEGYGETDKPVVGRYIENLRIAETYPNSKVFHAGTGMAMGSFYSTGGRVLGVTCRGDDPLTACEHAYELIRLTNLNFEGMQYRRDIRPVVVTA